MAVSEFFDTAVQRTRTSLGETQTTVEIDGERYWLRCSAVMDTTVVVSVQRGHTSRPADSALAPSGGFSEASHTQRGATMTLVCRFPDAQGTLTTYQARRANEAGFWEVERTVETRSATVSVKSYRIG